MRLRSKGLGKQELVMDFREYDIVREGEEVVVVGTIRDPVNWEFTIRVCEDDVAGMTRLILNRSTMWMLIKSFFTFKKKHHWTQAIDEHLAEGKKRLVVARQEAPERAKVAMAPPAIPKRRPRPVTRRAKVEEETEEASPSVVASPSVEASPKRRTRTVVTRRARMKEETEGPGVEAMVAEGPRVEAMAAEA